MKEEIKNPKKGVEKTIEMYCVSSRKTTVNKYSGIRRAKQDTWMHLPNCAVCSKKKLSFIKIQEASRLELH